MILNQNKTIYNNQILTAMITNTKYRPMINTTINEKLDIEPLYDLPDDELRYPHLNVAVFGVSKIVTNNSVLDMNLARHSVLDGSLYNMIPLKIKQFSDTVTTNEKETYRLYKVENINGKLYKVFYGLKIKDIKYENRILSFSTIDKISNLKLVDISKDLSILNPVPSNDINFSLSMNYEYVINRCLVELSMTEEVVEEIKKSIKIVTNEDPSLYNITEIGLCTGVEDNIHGYYESYWTQINYFLDTKYSILDMEKEYNKLYTIDIGGTEPMIWKK